MALEHILAAIEDEAAVEIARIEAESQRRAKAILEQASSDAVTIERATASALDVDLESKAARLRNQAHIQATRTLMKAREAIVQQARDGAVVQMGALREREDYRDLLAALLDEALAALPGEDVVVRVDPRDRDLIALLLAELRPGAPIDVEAALDTWGGVEVASADGRIIVRNALETRLERADPYLRRLVAETIPITLVPAVTSAGVAARSELAGL